MIIIMSQACQQLQHDLSASELCFRIMVPFTSLVLIGAQGACMSLVSGTLSIIVAGHIYMQYQVAASLQQPRLLQLVCDDKLMNPKP